MPFDRIFKDQMGRTVQISWPPRRIISVVPSQTELLFDLSLGQSIIGITKYCVHPHEQVKPVAKVGGTKQLNTPLITELKPDLIIANKEENERSQIEELARCFPVWISDITDLDDAVNMISSVGEITDRSEQANALVTVIKKGFGTLQSIKQRIRVAYFIWRKPYMVAGRDTFIDEMLSVCGFENVFTTSRYPQITSEELTEAAPQLIFLSSEPYPFREKHMDEFAALVPKAKIQLVDGEMFSWYGSRLQYAPAYFKSVMDIIDVK